MSEQTSNSGSGTQPLPPGQKVPRRIAATIVNSLKGGVVPRVGLPYITVGREREIQTLLGDLDLVADGGASFRFLVGRYGSGKSFLLQTIRNHAMGQGFAVCDADLSPERRLQGTRGQGLATYRELMRNLSTKTCQDGGALGLVIDRWLDGIRSQVAASGIEDDTAAFDGQVEARIYDMVQKLEQMVHGYDFARLLVLYHRAWRAGDDATQANVIRWLRGEYRTKTEARQELGASAVVTDDDWYDYLKLLASFLVGAGYKGLVVLVDELVNLYKIPNSVTRQYNYEKILTMYNDTLQGRAHHLGIIMGGTPQSVEDQRRGLYSYEALRSRLAPGRFADSGLFDMTAPVIHLEPLTNEELLVLAEKLVDIHAQLHSYQPAMTDEHLVRFLQVEYSRVGAESHLTPREVIRDFVELLEIARQNPQASVDELLRKSAAGSQTEDERTPQPGYAMEGRSVGRPEAQVGSRTQPQPKSQSAGRQGGKRFAQPGALRVEAAPAANASDDGAPYAEFTL